MTTYRPFRDVLAESLQDPQVRAEWDRTVLAREVSIWLLRYRKEHHLTQAQLAERLGWRQPVLARLERGEHAPTLATLQHLVVRLGSAVRIDIDPEQGVQVRFSKRPRLRGRGQTQRVVDDMKEVERARPGTLQ